MKLATRILFHLFEEFSLENYLVNPLIKKLIDDEIGNMAWEIEQSEKGSRGGMHIVNPEDGQGYLKSVNLAVKSTFPDYLQQVFNNAGTKAKFLAAVKKGSGPVWNRIAYIAIERLKNGYQNKHGYDEPNKEFINYERSIA